MMGLADFAMDVDVLATIGWAPLAVTTDLTVNFLRKPAPRDLSASTPKGGGEAAGLRDEHLLDPAATTRT